MKLEEYKEKMWEIAKRYDKKARGAKYVRRWEDFWDEKQLVANLSLAGRTDIKSVLDIGTGVGMLPYILNQKGIEVEGTDITEDITGKMFIECCNVINLNRFELWVKPKQPLNLKRNYDLIVATRTEFERQEEFDWNFFVDDCFKYCNRIFIHTNQGGKSNNFSERLKPFAFNKDPNTGMKLGRWCFMINKNQWEDIDVT